MLSYLLKSSDFTALSKLLSPDLLKVVSPTSALSVAGTLARNRRQTERTRALAVSLASDAKGVCLEDGVLELYFFQILTRSTWLLDFRSSEPGQSGAFFYQVEERFALGVAELYSGHYGGDEAKFAAGLERLGILPARELIRRHFGSGDLSAYRFRLATFQVTFAEIIQFCGKEGIRLEPAFLVLGAMLLGLYQNLEQAGEALDVQGAYFRARAAAQRLARPS